MDINHLTCLAAENTDGMGWYNAASLEIESVCRAEGWSVEDFTAILAVTSPRVSVRRNVRLTLQYVGSKRFLANTMRSIRKSVETWETHRKILGPKTSAFFAALMGDASAVVLDIHMANLFQVHPREFQKKSRQVFVDAVNAVADRLAISPCDAQACLWYAQKRSQSENPVGFPIADEYANWIEHGREFGDGPIDSRDSVVAMPLFDKVPF